MGIGMPIPSFGVISEILSAATSPVSEISGEKALWVSVQIDSMPVQLNQI